MEHTLSTKVIVKFNRLPPNINQEVVLSTFGGLKFDREGKLKDNTDTQENIKVAQRVMKYHSTLITWGVELVGTIDEYIKAGVVKSNWLKMLMRSASFDLDKYDMDDEDDQKFLFLRYYAFQTAEDWEALSKYVVGDAGN